MVDWSHPEQLVKLSVFYEKEQKYPEAFSDEEFIQNVKKSFWATNCWCFVEAAFAIIAPACSRRPHLTRELIKYPIKAMIAGGLDDLNQIIAQGIACATKQEHYVEPNEEGKHWLINEWPKLSDVAKEVFQEILDELNYDE